MAFGVNKDDSRAGIIAFSNYTKHNIKLNDHADIVTFNAAVDAIPLIDSHIELDEALRLAQKELFTVENGARPGIPKLLILITDDSSKQGTSIEDTEKISDEMRQSGITVIAVGIGFNANATELGYIAGDTDNVFHVASFGNLSYGNFLHYITEKYCKKGMCL